MKKFKEDFLINVLQFSNDEARLVMECQKIFPELLTNETEGFCINGRILWKELEVAKAFSTWIQNNLESIECVENVNFISNWVDEKGCSFKGIVENTSVADLIGKGYKKEYILTLDIAKEIAMIAGATNRANDKLKSNSKLVRKYFLLMEKAVKGMQNHVLIRKPEKENYNKMKEEIIKDYYNKHSNVTEMDKKYLMIRESNMINEKLLGLTASEVKEKLGYKDIETREHLLLEQNKIIDYLESIICGLVIAGVDFEERSKIIENICKNKYSNLRMDIKVLTK